MKQRHYWGAGTAGVRYAPWLARLAALADQPDDPRVGLALLEILRRAPWTGGWTGADSAIVYEPVVQAVQRTADERVLEPLRALHAAPVASRQVVRAFLAEALPRAIASVETAVSIRRRLEPAALEHCERLIDALGGRQHPAPRKTGSDEAGGEAALLELVLLEPEDDGPREVLSDYWLERGDPRGQLVTLQLKVARGDGREADHKAIRALLREHEKHWLGELALVTNQRVFRRGFLDEAELLQNAAADPKVWESAALAAALTTVGIIHKGKANETHFRRFVFSPVARSLREVTVVSKGMLMELCARAEPWGIEHLDVAFVPDKKALGAIAESTALPNLAKLTVGVAEDKLEKLMTLLAPFARQRPLACLSVAPLRWYQGTAVLATWLEAARGVLAHVPVLGIVSRGREIMARAGATGLRVEVIADHLYFARDILAALPAFEELSVRVPEGGPEPSQLADEVPELLGRLRAGTIVLDPAWTALVEHAPGRSTKNYKS
jgi:uncharacterized protein (TIGR02996 family)